MTCIIGYKENDLVYIGADSFAGNDWVKQKIFTPKVFMNKDFLIGYSNSFRFGQIMQYHIDYPDIPYDFDLEFLINNFVEPLREASKNEGNSEIDKNVESASMALIGIRNRLFHLSSDFALLEYYGKFFSIGIGSYSALGALHTLDLVGSKYTPYGRIYAGLKASSLSVPSICSPYVIMSTDNKTMVYEKEGK